MNDLNEHRNLEYGNYDLCPVYFNCLSLLVVMVRTQVYANESDWDEDIDAGEYKSGGEYYRC